MIAHTWSFRTAALINLVFFLAVAASAQEIPPRLTLSQAVDKALAADPLLKKEDVNVRIARLKIDEARALRKPVISFAQTFTHSNNPVYVFGSLLEQGRFRAANFALDRLNNPSAISNFRTLVEIRLPLYDKGLPKVAVSRAQIARTQAELASDAERQRLVFDVVKNYYGLVLARERCKVNEDAIRSADANLKKNRDYLETGLIIGSDVLSSEVEFASAKQRQIESDADRITTSAALSIELGIPADAETELTGDLRERYFPLASVSELMTIAMERRPDVRQADLAIESSRKLSQGVRNERRPSVDGYGNYGYSSPYIANGSSDYAVGASLTFTLYDPGRKSREAEAAARITSAEFDKDALVNRAKLEIIRAYQSHLAARSRIQVSITSIRQAEEANRIVHDRYGEGLTTFNEVLRTESLVTKARHDLLSARYDYLISYASLLLATGQLTDVSLFE